MGKWMGAALVILLAGGAAAAQKPPLLPEKDVAALANELSGETAKRNPMRPPDTLPRTSNEALRVFFAHPSGWLITLLLSPEGRKCPQCLGVVPETAVRCRHCGSELSPFRSRRS